MVIELKIGDCREVLKTLPDKSVHCCVTSPPYYGLRDYGVDGQIGLERTPEEYVSGLVGVFGEIKRVLRDDGTLWLNLGDSYSGSGKGQYKDGEHDPKKKKTDGMKLSQTMVPVGLKRKDLIGIPWRVAFALQADGWYLRQDIIWSKNNPMPESVKDWCTKSHEYMFLLTKSPKYYFDSDAIKEPCSESNIDDFKHRKTLNNKSDFGGVRKDLGRSRNDYMPADFRRNRRSVWQINTKPYKGAHFATFPCKLIEPCILAGTSEKGVCSECGSPYKRVIEKTGFTEHGGYRKRADAPGAEVSESSVFRTGLITTTKTIGWEPSCSCNAPSIPATVLDPFGGSGTVGEVCNKLNRNAILIELNPEYESLIVERTRDVCLVAFDAGGA